MPIETDLMKTYWKPYRSMSIRRTTGESHNLDGIKNINNQNDKDRSKSKPKRGFFKRLFWWWNFLKKEPESK